MTPFVHFGQQYGTRSVVTVCLEDLGFKQVAKSPEVCIIRRTRADPGQGNLWPDATVILPCLSGYEKTPMPNLIRCLLLLFILPLLNSGCKKDSKKSPASIAGSWELRQTSTAMNPQPGYYLPGNGNILDFTSTSYKIYQPGQATKSGEYTVMQDNTYAASVCLVDTRGEYTSRLVYDNDYNSNKIFYKIKGDTLTLISGCYAVDAGHSAMYVRVSSSK